MIQLKCFISPLWLTLSFFSISCCSYPIQLATDYQNEYPAAIDVINRETYINDMLSGGNLNKQMRFKNLLSEGGFELSKWLSNDFEWLANLSREHLAIYSTIIFDTIRPKSHRRWFCAPGNIYRKFWIFPQNLPFLSSSRQRMALQPPGSTLRWYLEGWCAVHDTPFPNGDRRVSFEVLENVHRALPYLGMFKLWPSSCTLRRSYGLKLSYAHLLFNSSCVLLGFRTRLQPTEHSN